MRGPRSGPAVHRRQGSRFHTGDVRSSLYYYKYTSPHLTPPLPSSSFSYLFVTACYGLDESEEEKEDERDDYTVCEGAMEFHD